MKKVFLLHEVYTEEIIGSVLIEAEYEDQLKEAWAEYQFTHNSNLDTEADIFEFYEMYGSNSKVGFEVIEVESIQL